MLLPKSTEILAKMLANRLRPLLDSLIGPKQVGFMLSREAKDNMIKALCLTHEAKYFSWFGRAAILKIAVLPRVLYLLRTLPIAIPQTFFRALQAAIHQLLWMHKKHRIKFSLLFRPKEKGGMGLPNFYNYCFTPGKGDRLALSCPLQRLGQIGEL